MVLFLAGTQGHVTLLLPKRVVLSTCTRVSLFRRAAGRYVSQESATPAFRRLYHAGKETELVMQFQVPEPTLWVAKGSYDRFQFELSTGTSTTFAERHLSCRLMAVLSPFHLQCSASATFFLGGGGVSITHCISSSPFRIHGAPCRRRQRYERAKTCRF